MFGSLGCAIPLAPTLRRFWLPDSRRTVVLDNGVVHMTPNSALLADTAALPRRARRGGTPGL